MADKVRSIVDNHQLLKSIRNLEKTTKILVGREIENASEDSQSLFETLQRLRSFKWYFDTQNLTNEEREGAKIMF